MKISVPLTGTNVIPQGDGPQPGAMPTPAPPTPEPAQTQQMGRPSLHQARIPRTAQEQPEQQYKIEFNEKTGKAKYVTFTPEPAQPDIVADVDDSTVDAGGGALDGVADVPPQDTQVTPPTAQTFDGNALAQQVNRLTEFVTLLAGDKLRGLQPEPAKPTAPQPPDPTQFDFYEPAQVAEFHRLNNAYIQATVRHEVNSALEPHGEALQGAQWNRDVNALIGTRGSEPNFQANMDAAIRLVAKQPNRFSIPEAYDIAASLLPTSPQKAAAPAQPTAKPAQRTMTVEEAAQKAAQAKRLPASQGVSGTGQPRLPSHIKTLGAIMAWNRQNGRAN